MKQYYKIHSKETTVRVLNTEVSAVRKKDIVKKAVRVIEDGYIGISGSIGNGDDQLLETEAEENLSIQIPYPYESNEPSKAGVVITDNKITHDNVLETVEEVLAFLRTYDEFDFSEVAKVTEETVTFKDSEGTDLLYKDMHLDMGFILKDKALANLFDGFVGYSGRHFDINKFKAFNTQMLDAYKTKLEMPEEDELPVIIFDDSIFHMKLMMELNGEKLGAGASLLSGKYGEKLFNDKITIYQDFNPQTAYRAFFDMEGTVNKDYEYTFVEKGVFKSGFTNKKVAADYDLTLTGSASGAFDDVPALGMTKLSVKVDSENIKDINKAIMIIIAAGGDYTSDGSYATPVQKAFLYEDGNIKGTLPEFQLRSHLFRMLGEDYIGTYESPFYMDDFGKVTVCNMKIEK